MVLYIHPTGLSQTIFIISMKRVMPAEIFSSDVNMVRTIFHTTKRLISVSAILEFTKDASTSRVVFKDSGFKSDADKTNIKEILKTNNIDEFITI